MILARSECEPMAVVVMVMEVVMMAVALVHGAGGIVGTVGA